MTLDALLRKIVESSAADWSLLSLGDGPIDLDTFTQIRSPESDEAQHRLEGELHRNRATYRPNAGIGLVWGLSDRLDLLTLRSVRFVDPRGWSTVLGVLWNGSLVDRYLGLVVDGGRAVLPFPDDWRSQPDWFSHPLTGGRVTESQVGIWRVVNALEGTGAEYDAYLSKSGFCIVKDER